MDGSWFNEAGWAQVNCLKTLPGPAAGKVRIVRRCSLGARAILKLTGKHYWEYIGVPILREDERNQSFDPSFLDAPADCVVFGYFQTPLYFAHLEDQIRSELSTHQLGLERNCEELSEKLRQTGTVAVHVRRRDYIGNPNLDLCDLHYYHSSMKKMRETIGNTRFFIFSDDPEWCAEHFQSHDIEVIRHHFPVSPLLDLHLMSLAGHHIIANSSYSWWAAWLGKKPDQQVMMPSRWFLDIHAPIGEKRCQGWSPAQES
ncbi:MAG: alpha-1,2-fucosyltransferase [Luteolibacter sp.]